MSSLRLRNGTATELLARGHEEYQKLDMQGRRRAEAKPVFGSDSRSQFCPACKKWYPQSAFFQQTHGVSSRGGLEYHGGYRSRRCRACLDVNRRTRRRVRRSDTFGAPVRNDSSAGTQ